MISDQKDRISSIKLSKLKLPLLKSISDAKVIQGKQAPLVDEDILLSQINTSETLSGAWPGRKRRFRCHAVSDTRLDF